VLRGDYLRMVVLNVRRYKRRAVPGALAIAFGVAVLVDATAAASLVQSTSHSDILSQPSLTRIEVTPPRDQTKFTSAQLAWMDSLPDVTAGYPGLSVAVPVLFDNSGAVLQLTNLPPQKDRPSLVTGRWPRDGEVALPDTGMTGKDGSPLNTRALVGQRLTLEIPVANGLLPSQSSSVLVVGVYHSSDQAGQLPPSYASLATVTFVTSAQQQWTASGTASPPSPGYSVYYLDVRAAVETAVVASDLERRGFSTAYVEQELQGLSNRVVSIDAVVAGLVLIIFVLAGLSVSNALSQAVRQRRHELGILLAVGFRPRSVGMIVVGEGLLVALVGDVVGLALSMIALPALHVPVGAVSPLAVAIVMSGALVVAALAAWLPTLAAMRTDPVAILREP
jgi:hypothetical protein